MKPTRTESFIRWIGTPASLVVHTLLFAAAFALRFLGLSTSDTLLVLTTAVSLEAIYLSIFIQMAVNRQADEQRKTREQLTTSLHEIQETIEEAND
jgi:uncharacterized membrane protein